MADCERSGQRVEQRLIGEAVADIAEAARGVETLDGVVADDAGGFLPAVLQRVQAEGHETRSVGDAVDAEHAALFVQTVVIEWMSWGQRAHGRLESRFVGT